MSQQKDVFQLPRHTSTVQQLANDNKIGKTTVVFARSLDGINSSIEKLNDGFLHFIDKQVKLGPGKLPRFHFSISPTILKLISMTKELIGAEFHYLKTDWQNFLKRY